VECTLVVIGLIDKKCKEEIDLLGIACENHVNSSRDQVISLYQSSSVVVFASLHEGFGLPIVESQAMWRPLVTSDLEPMKSVAGPGAILVDPYSVESIRSAILELLSSDESADEIVEKGIYNSRKYSPGEVTRLYLDLYAKIINET
jgi:glycosyltransferase involved in cell wall biosynthesis